VTASNTDADNDRSVRSPMAGTVIAIEVAVGQSVTAGATLAVVEAMKMHHPLRARSGGRVEAVRVEPGDVVAAGDIVIVLDAHDSGSTTTDEQAAIDLDAIRPDLAALQVRRSKVLDEQRAEAVASRHDRGMRTARENIADLTDDGLLIEYGTLAVAAQRSRRALDELEAKTPADGIITGLGRVNGGLFARRRSTCAIVAYDYTVMSGTQGHFSHRKTDRMLQLARAQRYPLVLFAEGAGGRPGDTDAQVVAGLHYTTFVEMGALSGVVPTVGIVAGRCFAGNAALLGCCDAIIATADANIGMAGPVMIEGGGLGTFTPEQIGPIGVQTRNGVVDIAVDHEAQAVAAAKKYLAYFQGDIADYGVADQRLLRHLIPENRQRTYDMRAVIHTVFDTDSVQELRRGFGTSAITALARIEGKPLGVIANDPAVLGGAIDADGADKLARFLQLCDAFGLPIVSLCDTPGFMVGPDAETTATVRHFARLFVLGGHMTVPMITVVVRKAYGLGAMGMAAGSMHNTAAAVAWPTGEFGGMNLEGAVRIAARKELDAIADPDERQKAYDAMVAAAYQEGSALNAASYLEIDEVVDPAHTRDVIAATVLSHQTERGEGWANPKRRNGIDAW
jgi:acetyl-CoA carboxylase carboxyltransferase component